MRTFRLAAIQLASTPDERANRAAIARALAQAARRGAQLAVLPEHCCWLGPGEQLAAHAEPLDGPRAEWLSRQAARHGLWLLAGSVPEAPGRGQRRAYNTALLFDARGRLTARYRKLHLFDPHGVPGVGAAESEHVLPGRRPLVADTPWGRLGLSICYDLRFPELYRALAVAGAEILAVPAAFTAHTGRLHWELLVRARAVENTCYVVAAAQVGRHYGRRRSWGQSLIADPWGRVLAQAPSEAGPAGVARPAHVTLATCQAAVLVQARRTLPCLQQRRLAISPRASSCWPSAGWR